MKLISSRNTSASRSSGKLSLRGRLSFFLVLAFMATVLSFNIFTISKYVYRTETASVIRAEKFYFTSDYLKSGGAEYQVYTNSVTFTLRDSDGANSTNPVIEYTLSTTNGAITDTQGENAEGEQLLSDTGTFTLTGTPGSSATVTATSSFPYAKTLSATFVFVGGEVDGYYTITDSGNHVILDIFADEDAPGSITVSYGTLLPDNTNELMSDWTTSGSGTLSLENNSHYRFIFFKSENIEYQNVSNAELGANISIQPVEAGGEV